MMRFAAIFGVLALLVPIGRAADPVRETLRLLPPDAGFVLVVQDIRKHSEMLEASPFAKWFPKSVLGQQLLNTPDLTALEQLDPFLKAAFATSIAELRREIFGDLIAFSYQPADSQSKQVEQSLVVVRPRKPERLTQLLTRMNEGAIQSKELKRVQDKTYQGLTYTARQKTDSEGDYFALKDGIFLYSSDEKALQEALKRSRELEEVASPFLQEWDRLPASKPFILGWLNPRSVDKELANKLTEASLKPEDKAFLTQFQKLWHGTDSISLSLNPTESLDVQLRLKLRAERLPQELAWLAASTVPPKSQLQAPASAFFTVNGSLQLDQVLKLLNGFAPPQEQLTPQKITEQLGPIVGKNRLPMLMKDIGPQWLFWAETPAKGWYPEWTLAVQLGDNRTEMVRGLSQLLEFVGHHLRVQFNKTHADQMDLLDDVRSGQTVKYLTSEKGLPPGFKPAFGFRDGYLLLASNPDRVHQFKPMLATTPQPVISLSAQKLREHLLKHQDAISGQLASWQNRPKADLAKELSGLLAVLEQFQKVDVIHSNKGGEHTLSLKLQLAKPLR